MKNIFKLIGIIAIVAIIGLSFSTCEDQLDNDEASVTIQSISSLIIYNFSKYEVTVTVKENGVRLKRIETIPVNRSVNYSSVTPPVSVTYSPASKVKANASSGSINFVNK